jgi:hypothetical protein
MSNLIKPSEYAKQMGISRQAVYAKIKKGILTSKSVDGKLYIVQDEEAARAQTRSDNPTPKSVNTPSAAVSGMQDVLAAKDETITVLKETIRDLKETNQMITSTLRSEVELLKDAFSEMKMLYSTQIEQLQLAEVPHEVEDDLTEEAVDDTIDEAIEETIGEAFDAIGDEPVKDVLFPEMAYDTDDLAWIELADFFDEHGVRKKKKREKLARKLKKMFKKGDSRVDSFNGELIVLADADYSDLLKTKKG